MSHQVQELIDKIKLEGVEAAQHKAKEIESQARTQAEKIVNDAKKEAEQVVTRAKQEAKKVHEATQMALKQASRDTLLSLRKEIEHILQKIVLQEVSDALTPEHLAHIIQTVVEKTGSGAHDGIEVLLSGKDLEKLKDGFLAKLQKHIKQPVKISASSDITKGFTISFDKGKSNFDFSDQSLAEYLGVFLNSQTSALVQGSV